jgi:hypothetical protein
MSGFLLRTRRTMLTSGVVICLTGHWEGSRAVHWEASCAVQYRTCMYFCGDIFTQMALASRPPN